jgi:hypothetical protein
VNAIALTNDRTRFGEIILPNSSICVIGRLHPLITGFGANRIVRYLDVGLSIEELLQEALADHGGLAGRKLIVCLDDWPIEEKNWRRIRPKLGTVITFVPRLSGGNALKSVLSVVVAIAAVLIAPVLAPGLVTLLGGTIAVGTAQALVAGGIVRAGVLDPDALFSRRDFIPSPRGRTDSGKAAADALKTSAAPPRAPGRRCDQA